MKARFLLSTCGTSLLTAGRSGEERKMINRFSNAKEPTEVPFEERNKLREMLEDLRRKICDADVTVIKKMSAELNGLCTFYDDQMKRARHDEHCLLCTDTWLGHEIAKIEENWLKSQDVRNVYVLRQSDLQTKNLESFQMALSELVKWVEETLTNRKEEIVFNLTGGFKAVQGFLQTVAMFYANEVIYIFEQSSTLMRIPRLPIRMNEDESISQNLETFRRLGMGLPPIEKTEGIPETMVLHIDRVPTLSPWGELVWKQLRGEIYRKALHPSPSPKIKYGTNFERSLDRLSPDRIFQINAKIDDLAYYLEMKQDRMSLKFEQIKQPQGESTHKFYAWSDQDAKRIFGHFEDDVFVLDRLGKHL